MEYLIGKVVNVDGTKYGNTPYARIVSGPLGPVKAKDRTVVGFCSVFGSPDAEEDIVVPGAFKKSIELFNSGRSRARFLWNHDSKQPPIAQILEIKEVTKSEMPSEYANLFDVLGALRVTRKYFTDEFSERVFQGVLNRAIVEMSFAYNVIRYSFAEKNGKKVRVLEELELFDCSDVNYGCHPDTAASIKGPQIRNAAKAKADDEWRESRRSYLKFQAETVFALNPTSRNLHRMPSSLTEAKKEIDSLSRFAETHRSSIIREEIADFSRFAAVANLQNDTH